MEIQINERDRFFFFWGGWASQFFPSAFIVDGVKYNCAEQLMMAEKARVFGDLETLSQILKAAAPKEQKALGRQVRNFDPTARNRVCRGVVYTGNLAKFTQSETLAEELLATGNKTIVEASPRDCIWGIGLGENNPKASDPTQWRGTNWLGIALMQVRETIRRGEGNLPPLEDELREQLQARSRLSAPTPRT